MAATQKLSGKTIRCAHTWSETDGESSMNCSGVVRNAQLARIGWRSWRNDTRLRLFTTGPAVSGTLGLERRQSKVKSVLRLLTIVALAANATAQQETKDLGEASLEELSNIQVYSASKHMQRASDAPSSVTVITSDEIQRYGYRSLADILERVRGFYITYDRDYSYVGVRGFGRLGDSNNRILVLIDGDRINDNVFGEPYIGSEFLVDVDLIDRLEIIRGPSSSLYGADAFFAVINVITRKAPKLKGVEVSFSPGSYGTYNGRASYGGQYHGLDVVLSGPFYHR